MLILVLIVFVLIGWTSAEAACTAQGTTTPNYSLCKPKSGEVGWDVSINGNFDTIDGLLTNGLPRAYMAGLGLANNGAQPLIEIDIAPGVAQDAGNGGAIILSASISKLINASFGAGTNQGCRGNGVLLSANTWYHIFLIKRTDTGNVDVLCDTSVTAGNIPSPYTLFRRIGSVKTDGGSQILAFVQDGDYFRWKASVLDVNTTNPGASAVTATLASVPLGVNVMALLNVFFQSNTDAPAEYLYVSDPSSNDEAPSPTAAPLAQFFASNAVNGIAQIQVRTNTLQQIRYRANGSDANTIVRVATLGWIDTR